nr:endonuclease/exonuclease/phosphatase family protein [Pseudenhygromyxa sp. WMMC2535]
MNNREYARWLAAVREVDPDVVVAVETDHAWMAAIDVLEAEGYGHTVKVPQDDTYGILVYSRLPLAAAEVRRVVVEEVPSVWVEIELEGGRRVQAVFLHPRPPRADLRQSSAQRDAELVLVARELEAMTGPRLVAGDLNDVAWSTTTSLFQEISGLLDPRVGRGTFATFHADHPLARFPLDHVFHSEHFKLVELRRLGKVGSDHFPILIELTLTPDAAVVQEAPRADTDTHAVGEEVLDDALEHLPKDPEVAPEDR